MQCFSLSHILFNKKEANLISIQEAADVFECPEWCRKSPSQEELVPPEDQLKIHTNQNRCIDQIIYKRTTGKIMKLNDTLSTEKKLPLSLSTMNSIVEDNDLWRYPLIISTVNKYYQKIF